MSFLLDKLSDRKSFIQNRAHPSEQKDLLYALTQEAEIMSGVGVNDEQDYRDFHYIATYSKPIAQHVLGKKITKEQLANLSNNIFNNRKEYPINTWDNFYKAVEKGLNITKIAALPIRQSWWILPSGEIIDMEGEEHGTFAREVLDYPEPELPIDVITEDEINEEANKEFKNLGAIRVLTSASNTSAIAFDLNKLNKDSFDKIQNFIIKYPVRKNIEIEVKNKLLKFPTNDFLSMSYHDFLKDSYMNKMAYPQGIESNILPSYNVQKWIQSMKEIYALEYKGYPLQQAFDIITDKWDKMEKKDFNHWLKFYQSNQHLAYKTASDYIDNSGALLPINGLRANIPGVPSRISDYPQNIPNINDYNDSEAYQRQLAQENKMILAQKVQALIGRLNAAEKIFTSANFKKVLDEDYEPWLAALHDLKRKIQLAHIRNASMITDLIILSGNRLLATGFTKSAEAMYILAEHQENLFKEPEVNEVEDPMEQFVRNLTGKQDDDSEIDDGAEIVVAEFDPGMIRVGQEAPPVAPVVPAKEPGLQVAPLKDQPKVSDKEVPVSKEDGHVDQIDIKIDQALANVNLSDIIEKLESLIQSYRHREASRELNVIDLMLASKDLESFFPNLSEAQNKMLESNQYVLSRLEDILSKLRGAAGISSSMEEVKNKLDIVDNNNSKKKEQKELMNMVPGGPEGLGVSGTTPVAQEQIKKELSQPMKLEAPPEPKPITEAPRAPVAPVPAKPPTLPMG